MCSSPHWQVGLSWFHEKLSPANREQRLSRWADFAKNCLPRIGSKELPQFREKYRALGRQKMGSNMRPRYIQFRDIRDRDISGLHCTGIKLMWQLQMYVCDWGLPRTLLTYCVLATPYGDIDLGQHWLRWWLVAWWHQAIAWTNVGLPSVGFCVIHQFHSKCSRYQFVKWIWKIFYT